MKTFIRDALGIIILAAAIFFLKQATFPNAIVVYHCMEPNLEEGQRILVNKVIYHFHEPERGDIIVFDPPVTSEEPFIKRVIGLPGESVEVKEGTVYIHTDGNTIALDEPYVTTPATYTFKGDIIPEGEYFVLGDNRNFSNDSHTGWTVKQEDILGKASISLWPLDRLGAINNPLQEESATATAE